MDYDDLDFITILGLSAIKGMIPETMPNERSDLLSLVLEYKMWNNGFKVIGRQVSIEC